MAPQKSVLITGCSAGSIGDHLAQHFAAQNLLVFATARNTSKISSALSSLPNVEVIELDTTSVASLTAAAEAVSKRTGGTLDYLVNNAGVGPPGPFLDADLEDAKKVFEVNVWGVVAAIKVFKTLLMESHGTVVVTSSANAYVSTPYMSIYSASKAALESFAEGLSTELRPLGIKVLSIVAGQVRSTWHLNNSPSDSSFSLRPDSHYHPVKHVIEDVVRGDSHGKTAQPVDEFARLIVGDILRGKTGQTWRGGMASVVWWMYWFAPRWVKEKMLWDMSGWGKVKEGDGKVKAT